VDSILVRRIGLTALWVGFVGYAFGFAPPDDPGTLDLIVRLSSGQFDGVNPLVVNLFNIMGVLPLMYGCFLYSDGRGQKLPAWAFSAGSFGLGAFALMPYLIFRSDNPGFEGEKNWVIRFWDSRWTAIAITIGALVLLVTGLTQGDWADFWQQWHSSRFIHVMSLDFCMLSCLVPTVLGDDMARRGLDDMRIFWAVALVPLLGPLMYLVLRPAIAPLLPILGEQEVGEGVV
jgi:hypothetical protein